MLYVSKLVFSLDLVSNMGSKNIKTEAVFTKPEIINENLVQNFPLMFSINQKYSETLLLIRNEVASSCFF